MLDKELFLLYLDNEGVSYKTMKFVFNNFDKLKDLLFCENELKKELSEKNYLVVKILHRIGSNDINVFGNSSINT